MRNAIKLNDNHQPSQKLLALAVKRDSKEYFIQQTENFVTAIFDERIKMIQDSPVTKLAWQHLEDIYRNYKEHLEG